MDNVGKWQEPDDLKTRILSKFASSQRPINTLSSAVTWIINSYPDWLSSDLSCLRWGIPNHQESAKKTQFCHV